MQCAAIRQAFLAFFQARGHMVVPSASLVPQNDPSLLFVNAGMVPFKDVFLGRASIGADAAVSVQRCIRAGGKHNDLENVGHTARHHTFFEMLGNFSFGRYFKQEAIESAWTLLTTVFKIPPERLWVTVYHRDEESYALWCNHIGVNPKRIVRVGDREGVPYVSDNFWQMADTGPCGPCTEIFYDHGEAVAGGPPGSPDEDGDRYIEIWNLVFTQFNRSKEGTLTQLPQPCVDTGMGLERIAAVLQGKHSNYEIDAFQRLIEAAAQVLQVSLIQGGAALRVIADHIRAIGFLMTDGVVPSNEGRGYVLRRIVRRAVRHAYQLGCREAFLFRLLPVLVQEMKAAYPEIERESEQVRALLHQEECQFFKTVHAGMQRLNALLVQIQQSSSEKCLTGEDAFKLHDTFGFPLDLTQDLCREQGIGVDHIGFEVEMQKQRQRARAAAHFGQESLKDDAVYTGDKTVFEGYQGLVGSAKIQAIYTLDHQPCLVLAEGEAGYIICDRSVFYPESGGQVGEIGQIACGSESVFKVTKTFYLRDGVIAHQGKMQLGMMQGEAVVHLQVSEQARLASARNHSATHLLHYVLRKLLGDGVQQKGSLIEPARLRFDFSHAESLSSAVLETVEQQVNQLVQANLVRHVATMSHDQALSEGAVALFGEKYGEQVRVVSFLDDGHAIKELCGGMHVTALGEIGLFKIVGHSAVAAGVRRIEAVTGAAAIAWVQGMNRTFDALKGLVGKGNDLVDQVELLQARLKQQEGCLKSTQAALLRYQIKAWLQAEAVSSGQADILVKHLGGCPDSDPDLRRYVEAALTCSERVVVLFSKQDAAGRLSVAVGVSPAFRQQLSAKQLIRAVTDCVGGKGGGQDGIAQAGGGRVQQYKAILPAVVALAEDRLST